MRERRAAAAADDAEAVGVVGHQPGVEALRQRRELGQGSEVAVHGENAVGGKQGALVPGAMRGHEVRRMRHVGVAKNHDRGAGELRAGPQTSMGQFIDDDEIAAADQRRDDAGIGEVAGAKHASRLRILHPREAALKLGQQRMVTADQPGGARADAVAGERRDRGLLDGRMVGQVEVVVAAKRQQRTPIAQHPKSVEAGGFDRDAVQARALELAEFLRREFLQ